MRTAAILAILCTFALFCGPLGAQSPEMRLNGVTQASVGLGNCLKVALEGTPGLPAAVGFNVDPGPSQWMGMSVPIGTGPSLLILPGVGTLPESGVWESGNLPIADDLALEGLEVFGLGLVLDPGAPGGLALSNPTRFVLVRSPRAGADTAAFAGDRVTLDGGDALLPGPLPAGIAPAWEIVGGPAGHDGTLEGAATLWPTLRATVPGTYALRHRLLAAGTEGGTWDSCLVRVWNLELGGLASGDFDGAATTPLDAVLLGPEGTLGIVGGAPPSGAAVSGFLSEDAPFARRVLRATAPGGQTLERVVSLYANAGAPVGDPIPSALGLHLREPLFDGLETLIEGALAGVDLAGPLNQLLVGLQPIPVVNIPAPFPPGVTAFSAEILPTAIGWDPGADVEIQSVAGALRLSFAFTNLELVFDVEGLVLNAPYTDVATLAVPTATLSVDLQTTVTAGVFETQVLDSSLELDMPSLTFASGAIPGAFAGPLLDAAVPALETAIGAALGALVPPALDAALGAIPSEIPLGDQATLFLAIGAIDYSEGGLGLFFDAGLELAAAAPGRLAWSTPSSPPTALGPTTPNTGLPYLAALPISDEILARAVGVAQDQGLLDLEVAGPIDLGGGAFPLDTSFVGALLPGLGFDRLPAGTPVALVLRSRLAPVILLDPVTDGLTLHVDDYELSLEAEIAPGYRAAIARFGLRAAIDLDVDLDLGANQLLLSPGEVSSSFHAIQALPGLDGTAIAAALPIVVDLFLPSLAGALPPIPLPELPAGTVAGLADIAVEGPAGDYLTLYLF